jgi:hypothetical protein
MMLQDQIFTNDETLKLIGRRSRSAHDNRAAQGVVSYAFGTRCTAHVGEYLVFDALTELMTSMLAADIGRHNAFVVMQEYWETLLDLVRATEDNPEGKTLHLVVARTETPTPGLPIIESGTLPEVLSKLSSSPELADSWRAQIYTIAIPFVLWDLRRNAEMHKIALPPRLTIPKSDSRYVAWRAEIDGYRALANRRFESKNAARKPKAKAEELA